MKLDGVDGLTTAELTENSVISVDDLDVGITEIVRVVVGKLVIAATDRVTVDAVTGEYAQLHAVVGNEEMAAASHDFVVRVEKQVVYIELEQSLRVKAVIKETVRKINRIPAVHVVVSQVQKHDPFVKRYRKGKFRIRFDFL